MASLYDQKNLAVQPEFQARVAAAAVVAALSASNETTVEQQTLSMGAVTAGTFTLTFLGQTTSALQWNSSAQAVQNALNALSGIGTGGVECTGGPLPATPIVINFVGTNATGAMPLMTHTDTLTGGVATVTRTTTGAWVVGHAKRLALAKLILANPTGYGVLMSLGVAANATVQTDFPGPNYALNVSEATASNDIQFQMNSIFGSYT